MFRKGRKLASRYLRGTMLVIAIVAIASFIGISADHRITSAASANPDSQQCITCWSL